MVPADTGIPSVTAPAAPQATVRVAADAEVFLIASIPFCLLGNSRGAVDSALAAG